MTSRVFTSDWVTGHTLAWRQLLAHLVGQPGVLMAEIGSHEGRSACWFAEEILTGRGAQLHCFDPWGTPGVLERFDANTDELQLSGRLVRIQGTVQVLAGAAEPYDAIYVDGDHSLEGVRTDAELAWSRLKPGGVMFFDDYANADYPGVRAAVDEFLERRGLELELLARGYQVFVRKAGDAATGYLRTCGMHALIHANGHVCG